MYITFGFTLFFDFLYGQLLKKIQIEHEVAGFKSVSINRIKMRRHTVNWTQGAISNER